MACDPYSLALPGIQGLAPYEPGKPIETLAREYGLAPESIVKLASNENPRGPSPKALEAAQEAVTASNRYPDGNGTDLRETLAARHSVEPDAITLGNGSNDVLDLIARTFLAPGRNAVFSRHAFAVYPIVTAVAGAEARVAEPRPSDDADAPYGHDVDAMAELIDDATRVVFVANPNNPTGTWVDGDALARLLARVPEHAIVVVDEAYAECVEAPAFPQALQWLPDHANLVVTRSFSKIFGLAGLRCGYAISSRAIADLLNRVRHPFNVNSAALAAAEAALADEAFMSESVAINSAGLAQLESGFRTLGLTPIPSVANFVTVDVGRTGQEVFESLLPRGVIVRPVGGYELPDHLRVTVGTEEHNERVLEAMAEVLRA